MPGRMSDILLVEDSADDIELTLRAFRRHNPIQRVVVVEDGEQALEYLFGEGRYAGSGPVRLPELVLLDLNLPKVNGIEVLRTVRRDPRTRLVPVVMLSTSAEPSDLESCYAGGANSYVRKPVDYQDFQDLVEQLGRYWLGLNKRPAGRAPPLNSSG
jgi:two-component system response regulator